jgi:hypothetical protein
MQYKCWGLLNKRLQRQLAASQMGWEGLSCPLLSLAFRHYTASLSPALSNKHQSSSIVGNKQGLSQAYRSPGFLNLFRACAPGINLKSFIALLIRVKDIGAFYSYLEVNLRL